MPALPRKTLLTSAVAALLVVGGVVASAAAAGSGNTVLGALQGGEPLIAGHRGDRAEAPENTIPAFRAGLASGLSVLETDVQLTSDGVPVLMHDATVDRTTDGTGPVSGYTLERLRALDAGSWFDARFAGTRVPTLDEFLGIVAEAGSSALVELKGVWTAEQAATAVALIRDRGLEQRVALMSFELPSVAAAAEAAPDIPRFVISSRIPAQPAKLLERYRASGLLTTLSSLAERPETVRQLHDAGLRLVLYTLNTRARLAQALELGADGIVTDTPGFVGAWLIGREAQ